jgi:hypothetical protein
MPENYNNTSSNFSDYFNEVVVGQETSSLTYYNGTVKNRSNGAGTKLGKEKKVDQIAERGTIVTIAENSAIPTNLQPAETMLKQSQKHESYLENTTMPNVDEVLQIREIPKALQHLNKLDREFFITRFVAWLLKHATWEEARQIEVACIKRKNETKTSEHIQKNLTLKTQKSGNTLLYEDVNKTCRPVQLEDIKTGVKDLSQHTLPSKVREFLISNGVLLPDHI